MIEDDFYATIKLKCGDEIFCKVAASEEEEEPCSWYPIRLWYQRLKSEDKYKDIL